MRDEYDIERLNARKNPYAERLKKQVKELDEDTIEHVKALAEEKARKDTKQKLDNIIFQAGSIAQKHNCQLVRLDFQQEEGLMSSLPI